MQTHLNTYHVEVLSSIECLIALLLKVCYECVFLGRLLPGATAAVAGQWVVDSAIVVNIIPSQNWWPTWTTKRTRHKLKHRWKMISINSIKFQSNFNQFNQISINSIKVQSIQSNLNQFNQSTVLQWEKYSQTWVQLQLQFSWKHWCNYFIKEMIYISTSQTFLCCGPVTSRAKAVQSFAIKFCFRKVEVDGGFKPIYNVSIADAFRFSQD